MAQPNLQTPIGQWVALRPAVAEVFESLQIDFCCGGDKTLAAACAEQQLDAAEVLAKLEQTAAASAAQSAGAAREAAGAAAGDADPRWIDATLTSLCDHIEKVHHAYLRAELPRLQALLAKVVQAHGANHPELEEVRQAVVDLAAELTPHMFKEENILFPSIRRLEAAAGPLAFPFGTLANPIRVMEHEHDNAGGALARVRRATGDYRVPQDACDTYRALLDGLRRLELDMHQHVHKENNILFPRAMALEASRVAK